MNKKIVVVSSAGIHPCLDIPEKRSRFAMFLFVAACWWAFPCSAGGVDAPAPPDYHAPACAFPPRIDGVLTDSCWSAAAPVMLHPIAGKRATPEIATHVHMVHDDAWLYLAFVCAHPEPLSLEQHAFERDHHLTAMDDSVELYLYPGGSETNIFQFRLTFADIQADGMQHAAAGLQRGWNIPWRSAALATPGGWNAEMAIPLCAIDRGQGLAGLRGNIGRTAVITEFNEGGVKISVTSIPLTWAPVAASFNEFRQFGNIHLEKLGAIKTPLLPWIAAARCDPYQIDNGQFNYPIRMALAGYSDAAGAVTLAVDDQPSHGANALITTNLYFNGHARWNMTMTVPVGIPAARQVQVMLRDPATGEILQKVKPEGTDNLVVMPPPVPDRNYYTAETAANVLCRVNIPAAELDKLVATVWLPGAQKALVRQEKLSAETLLKLPLSDIPLGSNSLPVELRRLNGALLYRGEITLVKKVPKPGCEVKIDPIRRAIVKNDQPFFPMGFMAEMLRSDQEAQFKKIAAGGFNCLVRWNYNHKDVHEEALFLETARKYNLAVIANPSQFGPHRLIHIKDNFKRRIKAGTIEEDAARRLSLFRGAVQSNLPPLIKAVEEVRDYPNLLGYYSIDEPHPPVFHVVMEGCRLIYETINRHDGYHPVFLLYGSGGIIPDLQKGTAWCDVFGADPYWTPAGPPQIYTSPNAVSKITAQMSAQSKAVNKPIWIVPMAEIYSGTHKRVTLPREQRAQTYLALIHGAHGLTYFTFPVLHDANWQEFCALAREVNLLAPALLAGEIPQKIIYWPDTPLNIAFGICPDIQAAIYKDPRGYYVLLAANSAYYPVDVKFSIEGATPADAVSHLFAGSACQVQSNSFSDRLDWLATRAYRLDAANLPEPVRITVNAAPIKAEDHRDDSIPVTGREDRKNRAPNPGFEDATMPGWPDYYLPLMVWPSIGSSTGEWGQDTQNPYEGKYCLKMKSTLRVGTLRSGLLMKFKGAADMQGTNVCWSLYLKADNTNMTARFWKDGPIFRLSTHWQRYHCLAPAVSLSLFTYGDGTVWADALQVERGSVPTEYER